MRQEPDKRDTIETANKDDKLLTSNVKIQTSDQFRTYLIS